MKSSIEWIRLIAVFLIVFTHTRNEMDSGIGHLIVEKIPTFGTAILSVVSGYLYYEVSRHRGKLFFRKVKSLLIPYLIANVSVLLLVLCAHYILGIDPLNRLSYDVSLFTEGLFALSSPPINPPTYFIRDIFVIFSIIALLTQREWRALLVILPLLAFGTLILRLDVAFLFCIGILYAVMKKFLAQKYWILIGVVASLLVGYFLPHFLKMPVSFLIFVSLLDLALPFYNTGRFSYLLHLYHSPVIVVSYPLLSTFLHNSVVLFSAQVCLAVAFAYMLYYLTRYYGFLKILSGYR